MSAGATRRGLLALAPALAAPLTAAAAPSAPAPDARLIRLCAQYVAESAECVAIWAPFYDVLDSGPDAAAEARSDELVARGFRLRVMIARIPARTPAGMRAKARVLMEDVGEPCSLDSETTLIARSLARDALAIAGTTSA